MPMSTDVVLPAEQQVVWPDQCPGCGTPRPGDLLQVSHKRRSYEVPTCGPCRVRMLRSRWLRLGAVLVSTLAVLAVVDPWLRERIASPDLRRLTFLGVVVLANLPVITLYVLAPAAVDITVGKDTITYEFARRDYARTFRKANGLDG